MEVAELSALRSSTTSAGYIFKNNAITNSMSHFRIEYAALFSFRGLRRQVIPPII